MKDSITMKKEGDITQSVSTPKVYKNILKNGMHVLVRPMHNIPKVAIYLWYNVGSKDEQDRERGIAHLIEHMIFKGTDKISESDINVITHMLSGSCNAFTSYDYTGYLFNFPTHHWKEAFPIMSDCMVNCSFNDQMLNSEMKAVIQELKMYKDRYALNLTEEMLISVFSDHPYHHPIIGYKQDLWSVSGQNLHNFYKKHYVPNNATLVVVGDINPDEVFTEAQKYFEPIPADIEYKKDTYYFNRDISAKAVTLYRDVQQPIGAFSFVVPGSIYKKDHLISFIGLILCSGRGSRLHKKLVDELQLATAVNAWDPELFDYNMFYIVFEPTSVDCIDEIRRVVEQEIDNIITHGITDEEFDRAINQVKMGLYRLLEHADAQAHEIGKYYLATGDENYIFNFLNEPREQLKEQTQVLLKEYFRPAIMHKGVVLPLPEQEKDNWLALQEESDKQDEEILSAHVRTLPVQPASYAKEIKIKEPGTFNFIKPNELILSNGLKVLYAASSYVPKIQIVLDFKVKSYYDPEDLQGLNNFVSNMLLEGTSEHTGQELADIIESRGMSVNTYPGGISMSMLPEDFEFGLTMLQEILTKSIFDERNMEKVRSRLRAEIKRFWDEPRYFAGQLVREQIYKNHPYNKNSMGTPESIEHITRDDLLHFYKKYISPQGSRLALVGDLQRYDVATLLEQNLGQWQGNMVDDILFPSLEKPDVCEINYPINRDQIVLCFAGLSVDRKHPEFDRLNLFDQILGGGSLGSMSSRLFQLREQTGLFYTIHGSLVAGADLQPGMILVNTIVSRDRLTEAEKAIKNTVQHAADAITPEEFMEAKRAIVNTLVDHFASQVSIAQTFLFLDKYGFSPDYFDKRATQLNKITLEDVQQTVKKLLQTTPLLTVRIGRLNNNISIPGVKGNGYQLG